MRRIIGGGVDIPALITKPVLIFSIIVSLMVFSLSVLILPCPALASHMDIEKDLQKSLEKNRTVAKKAKDKAKKGGPLAVEINQLKAGAESIKASHLLLLEKFRLREEEMKNLGPKALERHIAMSEGYKKAIDEYLSLIDNLPPPGQVSEADIDKVETHLDQILHKRKMPILGSLPYRNLNYPSKEPSTETAIKPAYKGGNTTVSSEDLKSTEEAPISEEIATLAQTLNWSPVSIYEYVKNDIVTEWYWGCMKGAEETLRQKSGNDCDQAALLTVLLRSSGFPSRYVRGVIEFPSLEHAKNLTGIDDPAKMAEFLQKAGIPHKTIISAGTISNFQIEHVWVESLIPYSNYRGAIIDNYGKTWLGLDTSIKVTGYTYNAPTDIIQELSFAGIRDEYLDSVETQTPLEYMQTYVETYLNQNNPGKTYNDILRTRTLIPEVMNILPASMQYDQIAVTHEYTEIPEDLKHKVRFIVVDPRSPATEPLFDLQLSTFQLSNKRMALSYEPETVEDQQTVDYYGGLDNTPAYLVRLRPVLEVDGEMVVAGKDGLPAGTDYNLTIELISPNGSERITSTQITANLSAIGTVAQKALDPEQTTIGEEDGAETILFKETNRYIDNWNKSEDELASLLHLQFTRPIPTVTTIGGVLDVTYLLDIPHGFEWKGVYVDASLRAIGVTPSRSPLTQGGDQERQKTFMTLSALQGSILENRLFEDVFQVDSISTAKLFQIVGAYCDTSSLPGPCSIATIDNTNINTILPTLDLDDSIKEDITNAVNQGLVVRIPQLSTPDPQSLIPYKDWTGIGYIKENPATGEAGYMLSGMIAGGMTAVKKQDWIAQDLANALSLPYSQKVNKDPNSVVYIARLNRTADYQSGIVGTKMKTAYQVIALDSANRPVQGVNITFKVISGGGQVQGEDKAGNVTAPPADQVSVITGADGIARARLTLGKYVSASPYLRQDTDQAGNTYWEQTGFNLVALSAQAKTGTIEADKPFEAYGKPAEAVSIEKVPSWSAGGPGLYSGYIWVKILDKYGNSISNKKVYYEIKPQVFSGTLPSGLPNQIQNAKLFKKLVDCPGVATINCPSLLPNSDNPANPVPITSSYTGAIGYLVLGNTDDTTYTIKVSAKQDYFDQKGVRIDTAADISDIKPSPPAEFTYILGHGDQTFLKLFHLQRSGDKGQLIDAGAAGQEFSITMQMFRFSESANGVYSVIPVDDGTVSFSICTDNSYMSCAPMTSQGSFNPQSVTNPGILEMNTYPTKLKLGDEPGFLYIRANGTAPSGGSTWAPVVVWSVKTEIISVPSILINSDGYPREDSVITYDIQPTQPLYTPLSIDLLFYEEGVYMGFVSGDRTSATLKQGFAKLDPLKVYMVELVINRGTPAEVKSVKLPLPVGLISIVSDDADRTPMVGAVTDGAARLRLQLKAEGDQQSFVNLSWRIVDPQFPNSPKANKGTLVDASGNEVDTIPIVFNADGIAEVVYRAPDTFMRWGTSEESADKDRAERRVNVMFSGNSVSKGAAAIRLKRPPVVLVHGLWGNATAWKEFEPKFNDEGLYNVVRADYFVDGQVLSIADKTVVQPSFQYAIDEAISKSEKEGFAVKKIDIVAHSMGGLVTRQYCFDYKKDCQDRVRRFITIATPHFGSELADLLLVYRDDSDNFPNPPLCKKIVGAFVAGFRWKKLGIELPPSPIYPKSGAIDDLATGTFLGFIPKMPMGRWADLPPAASALSSHVIVGITASDAAWGGYAPSIIGLWHFILSPCGISRDLLFGDEADLNDRIVKKSSQSGGLGTGAQTIMENTDHFTVRNADDTVKKIKILFDEPMGSNLFSK